MLDLSRQNLTFISGIHLGVLVRGNTSLTELNLHSNELGPGGMKVIVDELVHCAALHTLDLCNNVHAHGEAAGSKPEYRGKGATKAVEIALTPLQSRQLVELTIALNKLTVIEKLHLDNNQISELPSVGSLTSLKVFSLQQNRLTALPEDLGQLKGLGERGDGACLNKIEFTTLKGPLDIQRIAKGFF